MNIKIDDKKVNYEGKLFLKLFSCIILFIFTAIGCHQPEDTIIFSTNGKTSSAEEAVCQNINSILSQLLNAEDRLAFSKRHGLIVKNEKVEVYLIMASENAEVPRGFDVEISYRSKEQIQAFVLIDQLCKLSQTNVVKYIRIPDIAIPE